MTENSKEIIARLAKVAKIEISEAEARELEDGFSAYREWLKPMLAVDCSGVTPILSAHEAVNILREDLAERVDLTGTQKAAVNFEDGFYLVPPIME